MKNPELIPGLILIAISVQTAFGQHAGSPQDARPGGAQGVVDALSEFEPAAAESLHVSALRLSQLELRDANGLKSIRVPFDEQTQTIELSPFTMRAPEFQVMVQGADGALVPIEPPAPRTYRGHVAGEPQSEVAASILDGKVYMTVLRADGEVWNVQPLGDVVLRAGQPDGAVHAVYKSQDVLGWDATCGSDALPRPIPMPNGGAPAAGNPEDAGPRVANRRCRIVFDTDVEFYQANGSSISGTINDIEMIMNQVGLIYQNQVAISYYETGLIVRTALPQPYTSTNATTLLCQFGENWNNNLSFFPRNVGQLYTGKDLDGTTVGLAWIGVVCAGNFNNCNVSGSSLSYSLVQSRFSSTLALRVQDSAHELGHNWNACHCNTGGNCGGGTSNPGNCGIMTSGISGGNTFDAAALSAIIAWRDAAGCLDAWQNPTYVNWAYGGASTGSAAQPWQTVGSGVYSALVGGEVRVQAGSYPENLTINKALTINALNGVVTIGTP